MYERGMIRLAAYGLILAGSAISTTHAAPPWINLVSFNQIEADPEKDYALTENNGPYLIMACSFSGKGAEGAGPRLGHRTSQALQAACFYF